MNPKLKPSGIEGLGDIAWGTHFCLFYETKKDLLDCLIPFFKAGLEQHVFCLYVASEPLIAEEAERAMRQVFPDFDRYVAVGQIEIIPYTDWYLKEGYFDEQQVLHRWIDKLDQALAKGFSGLRFAANILLEEQDWQRFTEYEGKLEETLRDFQIEGLCAYNLNRYSAATMLDIIRHHQFTLARQDGKWERLEGSQLKLAHEEVLKLNNELEQRVAERTVELATTNEQLKVEIVERMRVEEALRESEEKFSAAFRASPIALVIATLDGKFVEMNQAYCDLLGYSRQELIGKTGIELGVFTKEARQEWVETAERKGGVITNREFSFRVLNGISRTVLSSVEKITFHGVPHFLSTILDITERKRAEEALRNSESNFRTLAEKSLQGIAIYQERKMVYANEAIARITGYTIEELKSMPVEQIVARTHPVDRPVAEERLRKHTAGEILSTSVELRILRKDGSTSWVQAFNNPIEYNGQPALLSTAIDITTHKQAEEALRESEELYRFLAENTNDILTLYDLDQNRVYVSPSLTRVLGWLPTEVFRGIHPEDLQASKEVWQRILTGEKTVNSFRHAHADGSWRWLEAWGSLVHYQGQPHVMAVTRDITNRKGAEEALRKSERVLREAEVLGHTGSWEQDLITGEIFNTEENLRLFFGDDRSNGADFEDYAQVVHPDDREYVLRRRAELLEEEGPSDIEYRVVWPDGSVHVIFGRATVVRDKLGQPIRVYGTNVDITERKRAEEALRFSEQRFQLLTETIPILVWSARADGVSDYYNAPFLQYLGKKLEEMQGWGWVDTLHPHDRERSSVAWMQAFSSGSDYEIEYRIQRAADGQYRWHLGRAVPLRDSSGKIVRWYGTCTDIHDRKQAEEKIRQYVARMEALAEISRALDEVGLDYPSVLNTLAQRTAELIGDSCIITLFSDDRQRSFPVAFHHLSPEARAMMHDPLLHTWQGGTDTERYQTLLAGNSIYIPSVNEEEFRVTLEPGFLPYLDTVGISSILLVPLQFQSRVIGTLGITRDRQGNPYTRDDLTLLQNIGDRAAMSIQNAQLFRQVEGARAQLGALSRRLLEVQEAERRALTTELHDRVGQNLTGLSILLQNIKVLLSDEITQKLVAKFDDAQALVEDTTHQIRDIMAELHMPELEDYGLAAALETYAERVASRGNLKLITNLPDLAPPSLPSNVRIALFRAAQEAISNVLKHADATQLEVSLEGRDGRIRLKIDDDGRGFEPEAASQKDLPSWGVKIMRERIESIGGKVQIASEPGRGTQVIFEIERPS